MNELFVQEAIECGELALIIDALKSGQLGIEARDDYDRTPLMVAVQYGKRELVGALLGMGADVNAESGDGATCVSRAIEKNDLDTLKLLLEAGADIERKSAGFYGPLSLAVVRGHLPIIEYLLAQGADIEARGEMDETPLMEAWFGFCWRAARIARPKMPSARPSTKWRRNRAGKRCLPPFVHPQASA
jgi:ankyrin repeat protein